MKNKKHTMVVTASFNIPLDAKRARYFLGIALSKIHYIDIERARPKPMQVKLIRADVKDLVKVAGSLKRKAREAAEREDDLIHGHIARPGRD